MHHTGTPNDITDYAGLARGIFANELNNGYIDIAYNWLIDPNGRIYEGRWAQDYPAGCPHTGERNRPNVQGAHALHFNADTIGIGLMGDYSDVAPTPAMVDALVTLMTWKCARWGIDPLGTLPFVNSHGERVTGLANICGHRDTYATACPGDTVEAMLPSLRVAGRRRVLAVGSDRLLDRVERRSGASRSATSPTTAARPGSRLTSADHRHGRRIRRARATGCSPATAACSRSATRGSTARPARGGSISRSSAWRRRRAGNGYWLVARDGGVFCFGDAKFYGSTGVDAPELAGARAHADVDRARATGCTPRDGGIFCFGDAKFFGSTGGLRLNQPIVGMAARPQNDGYWMIAADGGIFAFGHAPFLGSGASQPRRRRASSITASTTGRGYALLLADGAVFTFGDAPYLGSAVGSALRSRGRLRRPARTPLS